MTDYYDYESKHNGLNYTQIAWNGRKHNVLVALAPNAIFITCNYDPPGNVVGERPY